MYLYVYTHAAFSWWVCSITFIEESVAQPNGMVSFIGLKDPIPLLKANKIRLFGCLHERITFSTVVCVIWIVSYFTDTLPSFILKDFCQLITFNKCAPTSLFVQRFNCKNLRIQWRENSKSWILLYINVQQWFVTFGFRT